MPNIGIHALRLHPGADLKKSLQAFAEEKKIIAGWIAACVGSLISYCLRFANQSETAWGKASSKSYLCPELSRSTVRTCIWGYATRQVKPPAGM